MREGIKLDPPQQLYTHLNMKIIMITTMKFQNDRSDKWLLLFMFMESKQSSHVLELDLMCKIKKYIPQPHLDGYILWEQPILGSNTFIKKPMVGVNNESLKGMPLFT